MFDYVFQWDEVFNAYPYLLKAALVTLEVSVLSMVFGIIIGIFLALGKMSNNRFFYYSCVTWIEIARNTPALFQIYMAYFGLGAFGIHLSPYTAVLLSLSFNNAGYLAETIRGGLQTIPTTQMMSSKALGINSFQTYRYIILPQVFRLIYHPMTNQMIWSILMSSLGILVGMNELTGETQRLQAVSFRTLEFFIAAAVLYYFITKTVLLISRLISYKIFKGDV